MNIKKRSLGFIETFTALMHDNCYGATIFGSIASFKGKLNKELVPEALSLLQKRHPNLRAKLSRNAKYEMVFDQVAKKFSLEIISSDDIRLANTILTKQVTIPFGGNSYLWRCILQLGKKHNNHKLITIFHHSIADGTSAARFTEDFLYILGSLTEKKQPALPLLQVQECIESNTISKVSWKKFLQIESDIASNPLYRQSLWKYNNQADINSRQVVIIPISFPVNFVCKLKTKSRKEKVTVNAALNAAVVKAFKKKYNNESISINMATPINLRNRCEKPISWDNMGSFINWMPVPLTCSDNSDFWDVARQYKRSFLDTSEKYAYNPSNCDENYMQNNIISSFNCNSLSPPLICTVTNLGMIKFSNNYGPFILNSFNFGVSHISGGLAVAITCSTVNGVLHINFCYTEPLLERTWVENLIKNFARSLEESVII